MTKNKWNQQIRLQMAASNIDEKPYIPLIETLADVLAQRDKTAKEFRAGGAQSLVDYTNKIGATNRIRNPLLSIWDDLNRTALSYWRELGLTPSAMAEIEDRREPHPGDLAAAVMDLDS